MMKFKELREKVKAKSIRAEDGEEQKLADLASDESQLDDASAQNRNPDGTAEDQVDKSIKPIYKKTENGMYTLANEEVEQVDEISLKKKIQTYTKMAGDARVGDYDPDQSRKLEKRRAGQMLNKIEKKHGSKAASHAKRSADFDKDDANTYTSPREKRQARKHGDPLASRQPVSTMKGGPRKGKVRPEDAKNRKFAMRQAARHRTARAALKTRNEEVDQVDEAVDAAKLLSKKDVAVYGKKMSKVLRLTGEGNMNGAMKINATLPKNVQNVLTHVSNENELKSVLSGVKEEVEFDITENTIDDIKKLTSLSQSGTVRFADGSSAKVSPQVATALLQTHGNLNTNNQTKFAKKLASSAKEFAKLEKFALQQTQISGRLHQLNNL